jgi:hypothetical protein
MFIIYPAETIGHTHTIYIGQYLSKEFGPFEASVQRNIKYLDLVTMLRAIHLIPIICLPDFGRYDEEYSNTVLNLIFL